MDRPPLRDFQLDLREVQHMAPHVLSAAVSSAGSSRQTGESLWRAYKDRALVLKSRFTCRDLRFLLHGFAERAVREADFLDNLMRKPDWRPEASVSKLDLCSIAASLARLGVADDEVYSAIAERVLEDISELPLADLGTLTSAFSQVLCRHPELFEAVAARLHERLQGPPGELSPAVSASMLNALAVCSYCDPALNESILSTTVLPRIAEFSTAQVALVANSLVRCAHAHAHAGDPDNKSTSLPSPSSSSSSILGQLADCWLLHGQVEAATAEELTYLAQAYAQFRVTDREDFNLALAAGGLRQLSTFSARHLATFCGALKWLQSPAKAAFLAMTVRHALTTRLLPDSTLHELAVVLDTLVDAQVDIPERTAQAFFAKISERVHEFGFDLEPGGLRTGPPKTASVADSRRSGGRRQKGQGRGSGSPLSSYLLARIASACMQFVEPQQGRVLLSGLVPHIGALSKQGSLKLYAVAAVFAAHGHHRLRDEPLLAQIWSSAPSPQQVAHLQVEGLLVSLGQLHLRIQPLLRFIDSQLPAAAQQFSCAAASRCLLAMAVLGAEHFSPNAQQALMARALQQLEETTPEPIDSARLAAAMETLPDSAALLGVDLSFRPSSCAVSEAPSLDPAPPPGLVRGAFRTLRAASAEAEISLGMPMHGFRADLVVRRGGVHTVLELDGPARLYHGSRELLGICQLKERLLRRTLGEVVRVAFWEWPVEGEAQIELLRERGVL